MSFHPPGTFTNGIRKGYPTQKCIAQWHAQWGACGWCCMRCAHGLHTCRRCRDVVLHDGTIDGKRAHTCS